MSHGIRSLRERVLQTLSFEAGGLLLITPLYGWVAGAALGESLTLLVAVSIVVMAWSAVFNTLPPELNYEAVKKNIAPVLSGKDAVAKARLARELSETFRLQYLKAKELARSGQ